MAKEPIRITGIKDVQRYIAQGNRQVIQAAKMAVQDVTADIAQKSNDLVPYDEGELSDSLVVTFPVAGVKIEGTVSYGGTAAPYAAVQHEDVTLFHPSKERGGTGPVVAGQGSGRGAKYLEYPTTQAFIDYDKKIVKMIQGLIK